MKAALSRLLAPLASLRLTVALFALLMFLVFAGTVAQQHHSNWQVVNDYFRSLWVSIPLYVFLPPGEQKIGGFIPFPGGFLLGGLLLVNLVAAHTVRFKWSRRRFAMIVLHAGVILMIVGEMVTAAYAREGVMAIDEGSYSQFTEDIRTVELAVIDPSDPQRDYVIVVSEAKLRRAARQGRAITHPELPFEIEVVRWMDNSRLVGLGMADEQLKADNPATAGVGEVALATPAPPVTGVEAQNVDAPSAYITLHRDGETLGTYLASLHLAERQDVQVGDETWQIELRFKREYKPYTIHLIDFSHDKFVGTDVPRNFSSLVRLVDPEQNEDREVLIYMNHPLRFRGETFYQQSFKPDESGTVLQVVRNPGWLLPYISCVLVALGMLIHFGDRLTMFVGRRAR